MSDSHAQELRILQNEMQVQQDNTARLEETIAAQAKEIAAWETSYGALKYQFDGRCADLNEANETIARQTQAYELTLENHVSLQMLIASQMQKIAKLEEQRNEFVWDCHTTKSGFSKVVAELDAEVAALSESPNKKPNLAGRGIGVVIETVKPEDEK